MPRIADVLKELDLDKELFAQLYEKVMDKALTSKVTTISESNLEKVKKLTKSKTVKAKLEATKTSSSAKWSAKALKTEELGGGGFLSWLGFWGPEKKKIEIEEEEEEEDLFSVSSKPSLPPRPVEERDRMPFEQRPEDLAPKKSAPSFHKKPFAPKPGFQKPATPSSTWSFQKSTTPAPWISSYQRPGFQKPSPSGTWWTTFQRPGFQRPSFQKWGFQKPTVAPKPVVPKQVKIATTSANLVKKQEIYIDDKITVKEFSEKMGVPLMEVMKKLMENKIMTSVTASLDFDTALLIAEDLGVTVKKKEQQLNVETFMTWDLQSLLQSDKDAEVLLPRPPIVTVMGHVDHGKTSLLDYFRKTVVAEGEAWGITQSIWASMIEHDGKKICFIDTPGHQLFTNLRARGAKLTNIAVIVVAADDSVMPQTVESIGHAKDAWVPIIIAITKIDKAGKNLDQIKQDLAKYEIISEDRWGNVPIIWVSSKTGQGIPELLETILLQAEMLELKYNPNRPAVGIVLDAHKDPKQGVVSTIIVMTGTLKVGDVIVAYNTFGKIRRMQNWKGQNIGKATGGEPVQVLGITDLPEPGRMVEVVKNEKEANLKISQISDQVKKQAPESVLQQFVAGLGSSDKQAELRLILKSDGSSSLEALKQAVNAMELPKNVTIKIVHADAGYFSDSDLALAQASGALLLGYNISMNAMLKKKAESLKIEMKNFDIIYELTDYLAALLKGMIEIEKHEVVFAKLEVLGIFYTKGKDMTIWGKVTYGKLKSKVKFRVIRWEDIFCNGEIVSLHRNKDEVKEVWEGQDCGLKVTTGKKIEIWDTIEFYEMQEIKEWN